MIADFGLAEDFGQDDQNGDSDNLDEQSKKPKQMPVTKGQIKSRALKGIWRMPLKVTCRSTLDASDLGEADGSEDDGGAPPDSNAQKSWARPKTFEYQPYTTEFDEVVFADQLCDSES